MFIGLTGSLSAGKGVIATFLKKKGFVYISLSDELREYLKENKIQITRENLQNEGNKLRTKKGNDVLAKMASEKIKNQEYKNAIIDGIRNPAEVLHLQKNIKNFFLVAVDAPAEVRFKRMLARNRESDPKNIKDFLKVDARDKGKGEEKSGQQVGACMKLAKFVLINDGTLEEISSKIERLYSDIEMKIPRPTWDEYFMEICRAVGTRATCNRGRSGCVIAKDKQILVTGYVGAPRGLPHCDEVGHLMKEVLHEDGRKSSHCMRTVHAEQNAICQAARMGISLDSATIYCKMTPCRTCAMLIINCGIKRVVSEKDYQDSIESKEMFKKAGIELEILNKEIERY
ncbi:Dephospho-CoA kinase [uncultured archaeon]|nr:Dephospho-CoA kinase [uncultured archaeon]